MADNLNGRLQMRFLRNSGFQDERGNMGHVVMLFVWLQEDGKHGLNYFFYFFS